MDVSPKRLRPVFSTAVLLLLLHPFSLSQTSAPNASFGSTALPEAPQPQNVPPPSKIDYNSRVGQAKEVTLSGTPKRLLEDQKAIWTSPLRLKPSDGIWLAPFAVATGMLIGSDHHTMTQSIHLSPDGQHTADNLSQSALVGIGAIPASTYVWSLFNHAPQARETGILAGEAAVNGLAVNEVLKVAFRRDRPPVNNAQGKFFSSGWNDGSFPSNHSVLAWSMASVLASEYPGWLMQATVYGLASTVSVSRVLSEQHFPSDVLVGSVSGWLIGRYVYRAHHNYTLNPYDAPPLPRDYIAQNTSSSATSPPPTPPPPSQFGTPDPIEHRPPAPFDADPDTIGSTNAPMDSWIYPALERLAALGLIPTQNAAIRPWTRQECLRQLRQAQDLADRLSISHPALVVEARRLMTDLDRELSAESTSYQELALESVYARYGTIAGPALNDSFHFGQTWWNDFGRPQGRGSNAIAGFSARAHYGRLFFYAREEYQHSPGVPEQSAERTALINRLDRLQENDPFIQPRLATPAYERQRPIEMYAGVAFAGNAVSFGKQQLYWGPTTMGPISFSSNAEPTYNVRFVSTRPHPLPFVPSMGTYRFDVVLGKLSGHAYPARPWFNGQKISFNFGDNLELSFTRWSVFWGVGHPITMHSFKENVFSFNSTGGGTGGGGGSAGYGDRDDPGDRKSNFDFRYRLPFLSRVVTLYADAYSDDDPSPISAPRRAVWNPGIYFARLPYLPHMDLRVEAVSSTGLFTDFGGQHFFMNNQYLDSNTNKGFMLGNAVGRDGRAIEARTGYWFSSKTRVEGGYRQNKGGIAFLPGGSTITDGFLNGSYAITPHWTAQIFAQYERFLIPSYMPGSQHNTSGWFQITWNPKLSLRQ